MPPAALALALDEPASNPSTSWTIATNAGQLVKLASWEVPDRCACAERTAPHEPRHNSTRLPFQRALVEA